MLSRLFHCLSLISLLCALICNTDYGSPERMRHNLDIVPRLTVSDAKARELHELMYPVLWLRRRMAIGSEVQLRQLPTLSFLLIPNYYKSSVDGFTIDYPEIGSKIVNITINVELVTKEIELLRVTPRRFLQGKAVGDAENLVDHYLYQILAKYSCTNFIGNTGRCDEFDYWLQSIDVKIEAIRDEFSPGQEPAPEEENRDA